MGRADMVETRDWSDKVGDAHSQVANERMSVRCVCDEECNRAWWSVQVVQIDSARGGDLGGQRVTRAGGRL